MFQGFSYRPSHILLLLKLPDSCGVNLPSTVVTGVEGNLLFFLLKPQRILSLTPLLIHICCLGHWGAGASQNMSYKHRAGKTHMAPSFPTDPAVLQPQTGRWTGRITALLRPSSSPGKQPGCLPACKCEQGEGAIFKEEPLLDQTAEKGSSNLITRLPRSTGRESTGKKCRADHPNTMR